MVTRSIAASVSTLIGLNEALPHSLSQTWSRMLARGRVEASSGQRLRGSDNPCRMAAVRLAEGKANVNPMQDHARRHDRAGRLDDAPDGPPGP